MNDIKDDINHPSHYNSHPSGVECIDIVEYFNFNVGNAIKYLWRCGLKVDSKTANKIKTQKSYSKLVHESTVKDLRKAVWYIEREIQRITKNV